MRAASGMRIRKHSANVRRPYQGHLAKSLEEEEKANLAQSDVLSDRPPSDRPPSQRSQRSDGGLRIGKPKAGRRLRVGPAFNITVDGQLKDPDSDLEEVKSHSNKSYVSDRSGK